MFTFGNGIVRSIYKAHQTNDTMLVYFQALSTTYISFKFLFVQKINRTVRREEMF